MRRPVLDKVRIAVGVIAAILLAWLLLGAIVLLAGGGAHP